MQRARLRLVLAALTVPAAVAVAVHGGNAKAVLDPRGPSDLLVSAPGAEDLGKFAVVDMADALDRVAGTARTSGSSN